MYVGFTHPACLRVVAGLCASSGSPEVQLRGCTRINKYMYVCRCVYIYIYAYMLYLGSLYAIFLLQHARRHEAAMHVPLYVCMCVYMYIYVCIASVVYTAYV